jgi:hypothetical protein
MSATLQRQVHQRVNSLFPRQGIEGVQDLVIIYQVGQTIAAQQKPVAGQQTHTLVGPGLLVAFSRFQVEADIWLPSAARA